MLMLASQISEPSALVKWMYALILIGILLTGAAIAYGISKIVKRFQRE